MGFFLGFVPDKDSVQKISKISERIKEVFDGFGVDVRWVKPEGYHLTVVYLGEKISFFRKLYLNFKLKKFKFNKFSIKLGRVKLGISRKYKELIFMEVQEGGDDMRDLCLQLRKTLRLSQDVDFVPHLTLGRVSKELSPQENSNIVRDLSLVSKDLENVNITFKVEKMYVLKTVNGGYEIISIVELQ